MPLEAMSRFVLSDEDDVELSEEDFLRARLRGLQAYLNRLLTIPCVSWCKRFANFLEPDSGQMNVASEGMMTGVYGLQRSQFGLAVALLQQQYMVRRLATAAVLLLLLLLLPRPRPCLLARLL
jgi:hypothetical protein